MIEILSRTLETLKTLLKIKVTLVYNISVSLYYKVFNN